MCRSTFELTESSGTDIEIPMSSSRLMETPEEVICVVIDTLKNRT